jgi:endonuclease YncB( thermonuclease family)
MHKCRVRLYGIDTPESRTRDLDEKARGKLASKFLEDSINNGKEIILRSEFGQSKADVEAEHMVNRDILVAEGAYEPV